MAPTGEEWNLTAMYVHRIAGGKIIEEWSEASVDPWLQRLEKEMRERERVEQEMRVARRIQQASLPEEVPQLEGWQISPYYQPAREVGGDFYDFHLLSEGRVGACRGGRHGQGCLRSTGHVQHPQHAQGAQARASNSPGEVLEQVNDLLVTDIPPNMFVTCFYAILEPNSGRLSYANAGHDLPYLHR